MARTTAVGEGPIVYLDDSDKPASIPLSVLYFEGTELRTTLIPAPTSTSALGKWLAYLVAQGRIHPGPAPAPPDALVLTAAPGAQGNNVTITVATSATPGAVDIGVSEQDSYTDLSMTDLVARLGAPGTTATPGTQPGLLRATIPTGTPPAPAVPSTGQSNTTGATPSWKIVGPTATATDAAFVLTARGPGADVGTMTIAVTPGSATGKFNMTVTWVNSVPAVGPGDVGTLANKLAPLTYAVTVAPPSINNVAQAYQLPRPGTYKLSGGSDAGQPTPASATLVAKT